MSLPNPNRHMGDALQEVIRRFEEIETPLENDIPQSEGKEQAVQDTRLEYAPEDSRLQALGPAQGAKQDNLNSIKFADQDIDVQMSEEVGVPRDLRTEAEQNGESNEEKVSGDEGSDEKDEATVGIDVDGRRDDGGRTHRC